MSFKEARSLAAQTMLRNPQDYLPFAATEKEDEIMTEGTEVYRNRFSLANIAQKHLSYTALKLNHPPSGVVN